MLNVLINPVAIILGSLIGIFLKKFIKEEHIDSIFPIMNLIIGIIGIQGAIKMDNMLLLIFSLVIGSLIGVNLHLDDKVHSLGYKMQNLMKNNDPNLTQCFITAFIVHSVGAMAILGPLNIGLLGDSSIMNTKSALDFLSSIVFASIYGPGVILSAPFTFIYELAIYLLSTWIEPILPVVVINQISAIGSVLIVAISVNLLEIKDKEIKVPNYMPALLIPIIWHGLLNFLNLG